MPLFGTSRILSWTMYLLDLYQTVLLGWIYSRRCKNLILALAGVAQWIDSWLWTKGSPVRFPIKAHVWVAGWVPSGGHIERQPHIDVSLPSPFSKNKQNLKKKQTWYYMPKGHWRIVWFEPQRERTRSLWVVMKEMHGEAAASRLQGVPQPSKVSSLWWKDGNKPFKWTQVVLEIRPLILSF